MAPYLHYPPYLPCWVAPYLPLSEGNPGPLIVRESGATHRNARAGRVCGRGSPAYAGWPRISLPGGAPYRRRISHIVMLGPGECAATVAQPMLGGPVSPVSPYLPPLIEMLGPGECAATVAQPMLGGPVSPVSPYLPPLIEMLGPGECAATVAQPMLDGPVSPLSSISPML